MPRVLDDLPFKSFIATPPLTLTVNPTDITISTTLTQGKALVANCYDTELPSNNDFLAVVGVTTKKSIEIDRQIVMPASFTFSNMSAQVDINASAAATTLAFRKNGANGNQAVVIPAGLTGTFQDTINTDTVVMGDLVAYQNTFPPAGSTISYVSASMEVSG